MKYRSASIIVLIALCATRTAWADTICLEAESAIDVEAPMRVVDADNSEAFPNAVAGAAGGKYLEIPEKAGNPPAVTTGAATLPFELKTGGQLYLWMRVYWEGECSNSLTVQLNDGRPFDFGQNATYKTWHWVRAPLMLPQLRSVAAGEHTLYIRNREDGVRIDQVLITTNRRYVPVGIEE